MSLAIEPALGDIATANGWDEVAAAYFFEAFCEGHNRYRYANKWLVKRARLESGHHVLDFGAGTGRTTEAALPWLNDSGQILCIEPATAMRRTGIARLSDPRITWKACLTKSDGKFDRILCGATIWQLQPLAEALTQLGRMLTPGGALAFNIPGLYLGHPDEPGGGDDPLLLKLPSLLASLGPAVSGATTAHTLLPDRDGIDRLLRDAGLRIERWSHRLRITQGAYRDWLKIPVVSRHLLTELGPWEKAAVIDRVFGDVDADSWRWERWFGWTAWCTP